MADIVERLDRAIDDFWAHERKELCGEASFEITRLRADVAELVGMLLGIVCIAEGLADQQAMPNDYYSTAFNEARAILAKHRRP